MPQQTYSITAPNGKTLDVTGDHMPTETELHDIFAKAGVDTAAAHEEAPASAGPFDPAKMSGDFAPHAAEFGKRVANAAVDVPVGMAKGAAQAIYKIPGIASELESLWKLPEGSLTKAVESSNPSQSAGKAIDAAVAAKAAWNAPAGSAFAADESTALPVAQTVGSRVVDATLGAISGAKYELLGGKELTAERVGSAITKYGKAAVKAALAGTAAGAAYKYLWH